jgi:hypothetical protein
MNHMLARLRGVKIDMIEVVLRADAPRHAAEGFALDHLWQNDDDPGEVFFLFHTEDLPRARRFIDRVHAQARKENPAVNLPEITFLVKRNED